MTGWIIFAIIVMLFVGLFMLRIRIRVHYKDELELIVGVSPIMIRILPHREKKVNIKEYSLKNIRKREKEAEEGRFARLKWLIHILDFLNPFNYIKLLVNFLRDLRKKKEEPKKEEKPKKEKEKKKLTVDQLLDLVNTLLEIVGRVFSKFGRYSRIDVRQLFVRVASDDPAKTAQLYGIVSQAMVFMREIFLNTGNFRLYNETRLGVEADFMSDKILVDVDIEYSIRIWQILSIGIGAAIQFVMSILKPKTPQAVCKPKPKPQNNKTNIQKKTGGKANG